MRGLLCGLGVLLAVPTVRAQETPPPAPAEPAQPQASPILPGPAPHGPPDDKRRTVRSYFHNLTYNFIAVPQRENRKGLLITAGLTAPSFLLDDEFQQYFVDHPHEDFGRIGANLGGGVAIAGVTVGLFSAGRIARGDTFRAASYDLSQAVIVNGIYTTLLKVTVRRERPDGSNKASFPSGHASNAFAMSTAFAKHYPKLSVPLYGFATFVAVSRMAASKHHFSDIVAGSGLGAVIGSSVVRRNSRPPDPKALESDDPSPPVASWQVVPWSGPSADGTGARLIVTF
jgi:membrane-associated phospholipid phosphatase